MAPVEGLEVEPEFEPLPIVELEPEPGVELPADPALLSPEPAAAPLELLPLPAPLLESPELLGPPVGVALPFAPGEPAPGVLLAVPFPLPALLPELLPAAAFVPLPPAALLLPLLAPFALLFALLALLLVPPDWPAVLPELLLEFPAVLVEPLLADALLLLCPFLWWCLFLPVLPLAVVVFDDGAELVDPAELFDDPVELVGAELDDPAGVLEALESSARVTGPDHSISPAASRRDRISAVRRLVCCFMGGYSFWLERAMRRGKGPKWQCADHE